MQDSKKDTDVYSGLWDSEGEGEGGMIWENGIETCILSCKNRITSLCLMQDTACLGGFMLGSHVHPWWIQVNVCRNQYSIVK